jgi:tetratricopeptide (TPR) repeat protein
MSLTGNLQTMSLPDILQWISMGQKTGTLHVERRSVQKRLVVRDGKIFSSWSNDPRESLGQFLIRERMVTEEQLFKALLTQEEKGRLLGSILTSEGVLDEEDLRLALHAKATETIYDLFLWPEGQFEFKEGEFPHDVLISFEMPVTPVILEGMRRVDEWGRIREVFPTMETTLKVQGASHAVEDALERQALGLVAAGKNLAEMSLEMRRSEFDTADLAYRLYRKGLVAVDQTHDEAKAPDRIGAIQGLLGLAYQRLQEKRYEGAIKAYEEVLALDRLNQHAKKGLIAVIEARSREKAVKAVPLTKVPVLNMDLVALTKEDFDPHEGFVLSRVNGEWDVQSILKLCPMGEEAALLIFSRLLERKAIRLKDADGTKGAASTNDGR